MHAAGPYQSPKADELVILIIAYSFLSADDTEYVSGLVVQGNMTVRNYVPDLNGSKVSTVAAHFNTYLAVLKPEGKVCLVWNHSAFILTCFLICTYTRPDAASSVHDFLGGPS